MYTKGFVPNYSDAITIGVPFRATIKGVLSKISSSYITVGTGGDIVYMNATGDLCFAAMLQSNTTYVIGAVEILASGTVNGTARTTSASNMTWWGSSNYA